MCVNRWAWRDGNGKMLFQGELTVPANTAEKAQVIARVRVMPGVTEHVLVGFPPGCKGLVHVAIWDRNWQVWPWTPGEYFAWDGYVFAFRDRYPIITPPYELAMKGWSEDDSYSHKIMFQVGVDPSPKMLDVSAIEMIMLNRRLMMEGR